MSRLIAIIARIIASVLTVGLLPLLIIMLWGWSDFVAFLTAKDEL